MVEQVISTVPLNTCRKGVNVNDVPSSLFIERLANHFQEKNIIKLPKYSNLVKCSYSNEIAPLDPNWFFTKAAAVARQIYRNKNKTLGVGTLKQTFNKKHRRGANSEVTSRHGGKILRDIVKQLKEQKFAENYKSTSGTSHGLLLTKTGRSLLDKVAAGCLTKKN